MYVFSISYAGKNNTNTYIYIRSWEMYTFYTPFKKMSYLRDLSVLIKNIKYTLVYVFYTPVKKWRFLQ